jgi:hypothetical protein
MGNERTWAISAAATVAQVAGALLASGAVSFAADELGHADGPGGNDGALRFAGERHDTEPFRGELPEHGQQLQLRERLALQQPDDGAGWCLIAHEDARKGGRLLRRAPSLLGHRGLARSAERCRNRSARQRTPACPHRCYAASRTRCSPQSCLDLGRVHPNIAAGRARRIRSASSQMLRMTSAAGRTCVTKAADWPM